MCSREVLKVRKEQRLKAKQSANTMTLSEPTEKAMPKRTARQVAMANKKPN